MTRYLHDHDHGKQATLPLVILESREVDGWKFPKLPRSLGSY